MIDPVAAVSLGTVTIASILGYGRLQERANGLRRDVDGKADREVLAQIDKRLERIEEHVLKLVNGDTH